MSDSRLGIRRIPDKTRHAVDGDVEAALSAAALTPVEARGVIAGYEAALAEWFEMPYAVAVSSGTAALTIALRALGVGPGDEVIVPPTCPLCTVYPILALQAIPRFCDTEPLGFGLSASQVEKWIAPRTKAIVEVPMWGYPTDLPRISAIARRYRVPLVLDLAHAHGSKLNGRHLAWYGDVSCFSTHDRKPLSTGEGGFLLSADARLAEACRRLSRYGYLDGVSAGCNYKLSPTQAALGLNRLRSLSEQIAQRRRNAARIRAGLGDTVVRELPTRTDAEPNYYAMLLALPVNGAAAFIDALDARGIPSDVKRYGCKPLYEFHVLEAYRQPCPNAERLLRSVTTLPVHLGLSACDIDYMIDAIQLVNS